MKSILMHGPGISNPDVIVEREVPECDVQAYRNAGYKIGPNPNPPVIETQPEPEPPKAAKRRK